MKRVLIIRSGAVGDLILTLPVLSALKKRYEGLSIDMMGDPVRLALLKHCGYVDNVLSIDDRVFTPLFAPSGAPSGPALHSLQSYEAILSYLPDADGVFEDNLRKFAGGLVVTGRSQPADGRRIHMTRVLMEALAPLGIETVAEVPGLAIPGSAVPEVVNTPEPEKKLIAVHPGSGGLKKSWPAERYVALIGELKDMDYQPVITFGPADYAVRSRIVPRIKDLEVRIVDDLSLVDMGALLSRCKAMVGNDSGIAHLAAALGVPVIALFGPTDPYVWGPRGKHVRILWGSEMIEEDVGKTVWKQPFRPRSLEDIQVEMPCRILSSFWTSFGVAYRAGTPDLK